MREIDQRTKDRAAVLRLLERSGQNVAEFCREQGLPYGVVSRWRREARAAGGSGVRWVEIEAAAEGVPPATSYVNQEAVGGVVAEVSLGGGVMIRVYRREGQSC
jgi:transposase-like protein